MGGGSGGGAGIAGFPLSVSGFCSVRMTLERVWRLCIGVSSRSESTAAILASSEGEVMSRCGVDGIDFSGVDIRFL